MCAVAVASWLEQFVSSTATPMSSDASISQTTLTSSHTSKLSRSSVPVEFLDGRVRHIPLYPEKIQHMPAVQKDGGDDPDCTHGAIFYGSIRKVDPLEIAENAEVIGNGNNNEIGDKDYILQVGAAKLIVHALDGVGICTRLGLDCEQGKWAINSGPRTMLIKNMLKVGMHSGVWRLDFGVLNGSTMAKYSLNARLGIEGGISILGSTGLVRPFSNDAYIATIQICVRSHRQEGGTSMVFCTGGRTQKGAKKYLPSLPPSAFTCIADFIAVSIREACAHAMQEIVIACMPGKLCKYAAGFENTHAHRVEQDMNILRALVQKHLPQAEQLHNALERSVTIREALLSIPEEARMNILQQLAEQALQQLAHFTGIVTRLRILLFDFQGEFLFEKSLSITKAKQLPHAEDVQQQTASALRQAHADTPQTSAQIGENYFLLKDEQSCGT